MGTVEHEQWRLRQVDDPTKPQRKAQLVFFLLLVALVVVASAVALVVDVKTDGYSYYADQQTLNLS